MIGVYLKRSVNELAEVSFQGSFTCPVMLIETIVKHFNIQREKRCQELWNGLKTNRKLLVGYFRKSQIENLLIKLNKTWWGRYNKQHLEIKW